ncbi:DMT family transporter [Neisseria perflava]|uniref:DMT family transporter n=1 Tax=Neisseria perflava TaxID=33053 RepID=UPI0020A00144|nr:DMT family transporter [Neisseria perflava]MCP1661247.1 transporter family-2 protein [Neisseria perflava]MCP1772257.1 transporter family-2 protein [Neisseria perflava]
MLKLVLAAVAVGMLMPIQAPMNAVLAKAVGHPLWSTLVSLTVSFLLVVPLLLLFKVNAPNLQSVGALPWWAWFGGLSGAVFVASAVILAPKMGIGNFTVLIIAGQVFGALLLDHFGLFHLEVKPVNLTKIIGAAVVVAGILLVQYGNKSVA